jgi:Permuted papain-like amidase enzyme, YaeF/YiiX, C92 family
MITISFITLMKRWPCGCLLFLLPACTNSDAISEKQEAEKAALLSYNYGLIDSTKKLIQNGDVVFRNGTDEVSRAARTMNRVDTSYSHCGLVFIEKDTVFVYHALGGSYNPSQKLRRESIDSFCTPVDNDRFALYRYNMNNTMVEKLKITVAGYYNTGLRFDLYFNFFSDDKMYCSEFVFKSLNNAYNDSLNKYVRTDAVPFGIAIDDIFLNEHSTEVKRVEFKSKK